MITHGHSRCRGGRPSSTYKAWELMWSRCSNPRNASWERYGGRGIAVTERWEAFENFLADMGEKPSGLSLDRKDNNGNYSKDNCHWTTWVRQNRNRSDNVRILYGGRYWSRADLADHAGMRRETLARRLDRNWSVVAAVETPARRYG